MAPLRVRRQAQAEITEAFEWYLARSSDAPADFLAEVDAALSQIAEAPDRFPVIRGRLRRVLLRRFPYAVYCKVYPSVSSVVVAIHGSRPPDTWLRRAAP